MKQTEAGAQLLQLLAAERFGGGLRACLKVPLRVFLRVLQKGYYKGTATRVYQGKATASQGL